LEVASHHDKLSKAAIQKPLSITGSAIRGGFQALERGAEERLTPHSQKTMGTISFLDILAHFFDDTSVVAAKTAAYTFHDLRDVEMRSFGGIDRYCGCLYQEVVVGR
jgi:hypothetical protein